MSTTAFDKFSELESRIARTIELVKTTRLEKETAERELMSARSEIRKLEHEVEELRREREQVKKRVETLLANLSELTEATLV